MNEGTRNEELLAAQAKTGDGAAFDELVRRCDRSFVELAARLLDDRADADDVRQLAWLRVWQGLASFDARASFTTWAWRIVVNLCRDRKRARERERDRTELDAVAIATPEPGPAAASEQLELATRIRHAVAALPDDERECLVLRHFHDLSTSAIADVVGRPRTTVQSCLVRALARLAFRLKSLQPAEESHGLQRLRTPAAAFHLRRA